MTHQRPSLKRLSFIQIHQFGTYLQHRLCVLHLTHTVDSVTAQALFNGHTNENKQITICCYDYKQHSCNVRRILLKFQKCPASEMHPVIYHSSKNGAFYLFFSYCVRALLQLCCCVADQTCF